MPIKMTLLAFLKVVAAFVVIYGICAYWEVISLILWWIIVIALSYVAFIEVRDVLFWSTLIGHIKSDED